MIFQRFEDDRLAHFSYAAGCEGSAALARDPLSGTEAEIAVVSGTKYRSTVAASVVQRNGYTRIRNVLRGMTAREAAGLPTD